ncbi:hypothetical protein Cgig2_008365 [Carnegiea gigantea]|uniref:Uncharacterized protein n=1 Tax=Carnegiea gigantea TaxID=171969 RepID=A0A9Q1KBT3_9CARY|nr:hypothetical protein Cgig2_008365 [Carnegiea gigantea]
MVFIFAASSLLRIWLLLASSLPCSILNLCRCGQALEDIAWRRVRSTPVFGEIAAIRCTRMSFFIIMASKLKISQAFSGRWQYRMHCCRFLGSARIQNKGMIVGESQFPIMGGGTDFTCWISTIYLGALEVGESIDQWININGTGKSLVTYSKGNGKYGLDLKKSKRE